MKIELNLEDFGDPILDYIAKGVATRLNIHIAAIEGHDRASVHHFIDSERQRYIVKIFRGIPILYIHNIDTGVKSCLTEITEQKSYAK